MKKNFVLLISIFVLQGLFAQNSNKLGSFLSERLKQEQYAQSTMLQSLLVKGNPDAIKQLIETYKGRFKFSTKDICAVEIPYVHLEKFAADAAILRIENSFAEGHALMDSARRFNNIDSVQIGYAPLIQAYSGKKVVVGIIDGGIFFQHQDFRKADGTTRIRYIWDQANVTGVAPSPYGYGSQWDSASINAGTCGHVPPSSDQGHGTNVAGIAAGNGLSWSSNPANYARYRGTAIDANIIAVRIDYSSPNFLQLVADAVDYVFKKADELGMPCVINTSIGTYYGSHDGKDLATEAIENLLCAKKGRVLVAAAGNGADRKHHLTYSLSSTDSLFTWFQYNATFQHVYFDLWADTNQFKNATFALGVDNSTPIFLKRTKYYNILTDFNPPQGSTVQITDSIFNGITKLGNYTIYATLEGGSYHIEFVIKPVTTSHLWRLQTKGTGSFDLWSHPSLINFTSLMPTTLPGSFSSANYRFSDSIKTIVSSWQCSDLVITVANYSSRSGYLDVDGIVRDPRVAGEVVGNIFRSSSVGPTRDNRQKPDITATGSTTIATADSAIVLLSLTSGPSNRLKVGIGGLHHRNGGTSMASPIVTGITAMYLEKRNTANYLEVKKALLATAKTDAFTGAVPNIRWGYGKVNAFKMLAYPVLGCKDPASSNYNPAANIDTGGCAYNYVWNGNFSIKWNEPKNWTPNPVCCGPNTCDANVTIPAGTPYSPTIQYGHVQTGNVTIANGATVSILENRTWTVCKNWIGGSSTNALVVGGKVIFKGNTAHTISGKVSIDTFFLNNSDGATLTGTVEIKERLVLRNGTLNTSGGTLSFLSNSPTHCATIDFDALNVGAIAGNITAKRFVPVAGSNQHFISSPINNLSLSQWNASGTPGFVLPTIDCDETQTQTGSPYGTVFKFSENMGNGCALAGWQLLTSGSADNARGYSVYLNGNQILSTTGVANMNASYPLSNLSNSGWASHTTKQGRPQSAGWNLVGNPYLSIINLPTQPNFDAQVAVWQTSGPYSGTYQTLMMGSDAVLPPFQAFFVHTTVVGSPTFTIPKTACTNNPTTAPTFYKNGNDHELEIRVEGNGYADKTTIAFNATATKDFDPLLDANKLHSRLGQPTLFSPLDATHLAINVLRNTVESPLIPLGLEPGATGVFTLNFEGLATFDLNTKIWLEDKKTAAAWIDIKQYPIYNFVADGQDDWNRFALHFENASIGIRSETIDMPAFEIVPNPFGEKTMFIFKGEWANAKNAKITITNKLGQVIDEVVITNQNPSFPYSNKELSAGIYIATLMVDGKKVSTQKLVRR